MIRKSNKTFDYSIAQWGIPEINNYRSNFQGYELELLIKNLGKDVRRNLKVLDLGCGGGNVDGYLKSMFPHWDITGIDLSEKALESARKNFPGIKFLRQSVYKLNFQPKYYDLIISLDTLEHFKNPQKVIKSTQKILKDSGHFFLAVPLEKQFPSLYWLMYNFGLLAKKKRLIGHINIFNDRDISKLFEKCDYIQESKSFGGYFIYSILDLVYFYLLNIENRKASFESGLTIMKPGLKKTVLMNIKNFASNIMYVENKIFSWLPGGRCHYFFKKSDFFSVNKPLTMFEGWQVKNGLNKFLRPKDLMIKKHLNNLGYKNAKRILDYGCGDGVWLERILKGTKSTGIGVDISPDLIDMANSRKMKRGIYYDSAGSWPVKNENVDFCFSFDVVEHLRDRQGELKKLFKSIKRGGKVLIFTLNPNDKFTYAWLLKKFGSDYLYKNFDHLKSRFVSPEKLASELRKNGFSEIGFELYPGPFNLTADVFCYGYLKTLEKITGKTPKKALNFNDHFVRAIYPINVFLDKIFTSRKFSNGYFLWATKK